MRTTSRAHHYQIDTVDLRLHHDRLTNVTGGGSDKTPARIGSIDVLQHRRLQFCFAIEVRRAVEENQLGFMCAGECESVAHRFSGVRRQVSRTKNSFDINHWRQASSPPFRELFRWPHDLDRAMRT